MKALKIIWAVAITIVALAGWIVHPAPGINGPSLVYTAGQQTLTEKTLVAPIISQIDQEPARDHTLTLPAEQGTLATQAWAQANTNIAPAGLIYPTENQSAIADNTILKKSGANLVASGITDNGTPYYAGIQIPTESWLPPTGANPFAVGGAVFTDNASIYTLAVSRNVATPGNVTATGTVSGG